MAVKGDILLVHLARAQLAWCLDAVAVVDEDFPGWFFV